MTADARASTAAVSMTARDLLGPSPLGAPPAGSAPAGPQAPGGAPTTDSTLGDDAAPGTEPAPTADEYLERYRRVPYRTLQALLATGDTDEIGQTAGAWYSASNSLYALADHMAAGLRALRQNWSGDGADAFARTAYALVARVLQLADEAAAVQAGLVMMASSLGLAQDAAADLPRQPGRWPVGVLDPAWGYTHDDPRSPQDRLARIVADLALQYAMIERKVWYGRHPGRAAEPPPEPGAETERGTALQANAATSPVSPMAGAVVVESATANRLAATNPVPSGAVTGPGVMPMGMMGAAGAAAAGDATRGGAVRLRESAAGALSWLDDEVETIDAAEEPPLGDPEGDRRR